MSSAHKVTGTREAMDTVEQAATTPDVEQPWAELGLKEDEYARIREILGRRPTMGVEEQPVGDVHHRRRARPRGGDGDQPFGLIVGGDDRGGRQATQVGAFAPGRLQRLQVGADGFQAAGFQRQVEQRLCVALADFRRSEIVSH